MNFTNFTPFYDFSVIETAVQSAFVAADGSFFVAPLGETDAARKDWTPGAGNVPFYTVANQLVFQECRPRVAIRLHNVNHIRDAYAIDANNNVREKAWQGSMDFGIVTEPNYAYHAQLRAAVLAIIPQIMPQVVADNSTFATTGINALLANFQVSEFWARNCSTEVAVVAGAYMSLIPVELAFSVPPSAWPAGSMQTY